MFLFVLYLLIYLFLKKREPILAPSTVWEIISAAFCRAALQNRVLGPQSRRNKRGIFKEIMQYATLGERSPGSAAGILLYPSIFALALACRSSHSGVAAPVMRAGR